jgi:predicted ArsR family transcriptional regulator
MSIQAPHSDADLLDLLRIAGPLRVTEMAEAMEVTATAVRQRLVRMLSRGFIQREAIRTGRGRPRHNYYLTEKGLRQTGSNFTDLAVALWREVRTVNDPELRRDLLRRIARALASGYADQIRGETPAERMESLRELLSQRRIPMSVDDLQGRTTLTSHACPYPSLAENDRDICSMEQMMFSELLGADVNLTRCRLDGQGECQFQLQQ